MEAHISQASVKSERVLIRRILAGMGAQDLDPISRSRSDLSIPISRYRSGIASLESVTYNSCVGHAKFQEKEHLV